MKTRWFKWIATAVLVAGLALPVLADDVKSAANDVKSCMQLAQVVRMVATWRNNGASVEHATSNVNLACKAADLSAADCERVRGITTAVYHAKVKMDADDEAAVVLGACVELKEKK
jgi:hypothetical protein